MSILRNRTQDSFTIVNQSITKDKELGITERGLLITILSLPDNWEFTIAGLQQILPDGKEKISNSIKKLEEAGYIIRHQSKVNGKFGANEIEVYQEKKQHKANGEKPSAGNPSTDTTPADNPKQSSNNIINNSRVNTNKVCSARAVMGITSQQKDELVRKYGSELVESKISRALAYKNLNVTYELIDEWCGEWKVRAKSNQVAKGSYNGYLQRDYDVNEIERQLLLR